MINFKLYFLVVGILHISVIVMLSKLRIIWAFTYRNVLIDFQYKFKLVVDFVWSLATAVAFAFMGVAFQFAGDFTGGIQPYQFFLVNTIVWTVVGTPFLEGSNSVTDEASWGTLGFMMTNKVDFDDIALGRYFASGLRFFLIFLALLPIAYIGNSLHADPFTFLEALVVIGLMFFFLGGFVLMMTALTVLHKRLGNFPAIVLHLIRIASTYYTPLSTFDKVYPGLSGVAYYFPTTCALVEVRKMLIINDASGFLFVVRISLLSSIIVYAMGLALVYIASIEARRKATLERY